jgi:hypothetical protein
MVLDSMRDIQCGDVVMKLVSISFWCRGLAELAAKGHAELVPQLLS